MSPEHTESTDDFDREEGPAYRVEQDPADVPGHLQRMLDHMRREEPDGDFVFEGVDVESAAGVWMAGLSVYYPDEDTPSTPDEIVAGASPTGPYGVLMRDWSDRARAALHDTWGEPVLHTPRLVGSEQEPESILDYLLVAQNFAQAEVWDHGPLFAALLADWAGEPGESLLRQILLLLPREFMMGGMAAVASEESLAYPRLMYGEHPLELRRRAWILSTAFGVGEERVRDMPIEASRFSLRSNDGTTTVWTFADDGRQLLLMFDPSSEVLESVTEQFDADHSTDEEGLRDAQLLLMRRFLDGIPEDLLACIPARAETRQGEIAEHALEFGLLGGVPVPLITGAFWFDGETWRATRGLVWTGKNNGLGIDDFGVRAAVRGPFGLGGAFNSELFSGGEPAQASGMAELFALCPYPEQPRPEGLVRLGYGMPGVAERDGMAEEVERLTAAWWTTTLADVAFDDETFVVGGRTLTDKWDPGVLMTTIGRGESWTRDALEEWVDGLRDQWTERWGEPLQMTAANTRTGADRRTPLARVLRGSGLRKGPLWWVNGHAVVLLWGTPDPEWGDQPEVILVIGQADTLLELLGTQYLYDVRMRARQISQAAAIAGADVADRSALEAHQLIAWNGPPLPGSDIVPLATRGGLRTGGIFWVWHFTHDGRGLLTAHAIGDQSGTLSEQIELFRGVPDDLLSLVVDQKPEGLYPVVTGEPQLGAATARERAQRMPNAKAVFFHDGDDWRASQGMLRLAHTVSVAEAIAGAGADAATDADADAGLTANPLSVLYSESVGVPQLQWALRVEDTFTSAVVASPGYGDFCFARRLTSEEAQRAFAEVVPAQQAALTTSLAQMMDAVAERVGYRNLLDAALSNLDAQHRRECALWLLGAGADPKIQLSGQTPLAVLVENPLLSHRDAVVVSALLNAGADPGFGLLGPIGGRHPLIRLCERPLDEAQILPLVDALLNDRDGEPRYEMRMPVTPDGRSLLDHVKDSRKLHRHKRNQVIARLEAYAARHGQ